jgi:hypothetical protein
MPRKHKGQLTMSGEWARHLRPWLRRVFWKGERQAENRLVRAEEQTVDPIAERATRTVEQLLAAVDALPREATELDLWVPYALTLRGEPVPTDAAMAIVLDKALERGLHPVGFTPASDGRLYQYRSE